MKLDNKNFKFYINGTFDTQVADNDLTAQGTWGKTLVPEICRLLESHGVKTITAVNLEAAGKNINLPVKAGAID